MIFILQQWKLSIKDLKKICGTSQWLPLPWSCVSLNLFGLSLVVLWLWQRYFSKKIQKKQRLIQRSAHGSKFCLGYLMDQYVHDLFNMFLCDLLFIMNDTELSSYAKEHISFFIDKSIVDVKLKL